MGLTSNKIELLSDRQLIDTTTQIAVNVEIKATGMEMGMVSSPDRPTFGGCVC